MRYMHAILGWPPLAFDDSSRGRPSAEGGNSPMLGKFVQVYLDDILIFSKTKGEPLVHMRMILEILKHHSLYAKASKRQFGRTSVAFLGHVISRRGIIMDPRKAAAIRD